MEKIDSKALPLARLQAFLGELGQPAFRAKQVFGWLHEKHAERFDDMTSLPAALRKTLEERCTLTRLTVRRRLESKLDGTRKYLLGLPDGESVECVLMRYKHGLSLCISTQVGCRMGCSFCASTLTGLCRNLTASEMLEQVYTAQREGGERVSSVVLMGIGEPLDNFDNVMDFLEILSSPLGAGLSLRHVSLSTCGLVPRIYELAEKRLQLTLSVSLHAPNDALREQIMPVAKRWKLAELMQACRDYFEATGRRVSYEYALIGGVSDTPECARQLAKLLEGQTAHVNLIPVNEVKERDYKRGSRASVEAFEALLGRYHVNATVRRELGADIMAACGQLRREDRGGEAIC